MYVYRGTERESFSPKVKEEFVSTQPTPEPEKPKKTNWTLILSVILLLLVIMTLFYISFRK